MRVKVGDQWHDSEEEPVCVEFVWQDGGERVGS